jgi:hypothetical protein
VRLDLAENSVVMPAPALQDHFNASKEQTLEQLLKNPKKGADIAVDSGYFGMNYPGLMAVQASHCMPSQCMLSCNVRKLDWFSYPANLLISKEIKG